MSKSLLHPNDAPQWEDVPEGQALKLNDMDFAAPIHASEGQYYQALFYRKIFALAAEIGVPKAEKEIRKREPDLFNASHSDDPQERLESALRFEYGQAGGRTDPEAILLKVQALLPDECAGLRRRP